MFKTQSEIIEDLKATIELLIDAVDAAEYVEVDHENNIMVVWQGNNTFNAYSTLTGEIGETFTHGGDPLDPQSARVKAREILSRYWIERVDIEEVVTSYLECMIWQLPEMVARCNPDQHESGMMIVKADDYIDVDDLPEKYKEEVEYEIEEFVRDNATDIKRFLEHNDLEDLGTNIMLSRERHGAGFFASYPEINELQEQAELLGSDDRGREEVEALLFEMLKEEYDGKEEFILTYA